MSRAAFALSLVRKHTVRQAKTCPYCGSPETTRLQRKSVLLQLRRCDQCALMFRYPKDDQRENRRFYQKAYRQDTVTDLPPAKDIAQHIANRFAGVGRDLTEHLSVMGALEGKRVLDYGCSWGYCVYQLQQAGGVAQGFEISEPRVAYGREVLEVDLTSQMDELPDASFDVIYSAHVLEHIPDPRISFQNFDRLLAPGGKVFLFVPNGGGKAAREKGVGWEPMIGEKHVLALDAGFFGSSLPEYGFRVKFTSSPYKTEPRALEDGPDLDGEELLVVMERASP